MKILDLTGKLPAHKRKRYKKREVSEVKSIAIHHSATTSGTPEAFARYHVESNDWPGIGYHYVILKNGTVFKCNPLTAMTYHVGNSNREAIGICLVGNFDIDHPTQQQLSSLRKLIEEIKSGLPGGIKVLRHHDYPGYDWKSCPGRFFPWPL